MLVPEEHEHLVRMLKESISLMCQNSLDYDMELSVEGLLGITLDKKEVVLVSIHESFHTIKAVKPPSRGGPPVQKRSQKVLAIEEERGESPPSSSKKTRSWHRSRDSTDGQQIEHPKQPRKDPSTQSQAESGMDNVLSGELDFSNIVIKQEIEDNSMTSDRVEDTSFTEESFERTWHSLTEPKDRQASDVQQMAPNCNSSTSESAEGCSQARRVTETDDHLECTASSEKDAVEACSSKTNREDGQILHSPDKDQGGGGKPKNTPARRVGQKILDASPSVLEKNDLGRQRTWKSRKLKRIFELMYEVKTECTKEPVEMLVVMKEIKKPPRFKYGGFGSLLTDYKAQHLEGQRHAKFYAEHMFVTALHPKLERPAKSLPQKSTFL